MAAGKRSPFYKFTVALPRVDKIEIFKLDRLFLKDEEDGVKIPSSGKAHVAALATLTGQDAENLAGTWRVLKLGTGAGCFSPGYYIKFYSSEGLTLETSVCFHCSSLTLPNGNGGNQKWSFGTDGKEGKELFAKLEMLFPHASH